MKDKKVLLKAYNNSEKLNISKGSKEEEKYQKGLQLNLSGKALTKKERIQNNLKILEKDIKGFIKCMVN